MLNTAKYAFLCLFVFASVYGCSQEPQDLSIPMKAGEYMTTVTKVSSNVKNPPKRSKVRCYRSPSFDPYKTYHQNEACKISNVSKTSTDVSFDFACTKGAAAEAKGTMKYSVNGDHIQWSSSLRSVDGNKVNIVSSGEGDYIGKCK